MWSVACFDARFARKFPRRKTIPPLSPRDPRPLAPCISSQAPVMPSINTALYTHGLWCYIYLLLQEKHLRPIEVERPNLPPTASRRDQAHLPFLASTAALDEKSKSPAGDRPTCCNARPVDRENPRLSRVFFRRPKGLHTVSATCRRFEAEINADVKETTCPCPAPKRIDPSSYDPP